MHGCAFFACEIVVAVDELCVYREADRSDQARGVCYSSKGKG